MLQRTKKFSSQKLTDFPTLSLQYLSRFKTFLFMKFPIHTSFSKLFLLKSSSFQIFLKLYNSQILSFSQLVSHQHDLFFRCLLFCFSLILSNQNSCECLFSSSSSSLSKIKVNKVTAAHRTNTSSFHASFSFSFPKFV